MYNELVAVQVDDLCQDDGDGGARTAAERRLAVVGTRLLGGSSVGLGVGPGSEADHPAM